MKLIKAKHTPYKRSEAHNDAVKAIKQFLDMHVRCVEVIEHGYKNAKNLNHRLYMEIKNLGLKNIKNSKCGEHVYLINTLIPEEE